MAKKPNREQQISDAIHNLIHGKLQATNAEIMLAVLGFAASDGYAEAMADQQFAAQCDVRAADAVKLSPAAYRRKHFCVAEPPKAKARAAKAGR